MSLSFAPLDPTLPISAEKLLAKIAEIEQYVNGGVAVTDIKAAGWVKTQHLFRPEFFGSPAPRCHATTADTHWRWTPNDQKERSYHHPDVTSEFLPIRGLCATVKCPDNNVGFTVQATWYAFEFGSAQTGVYPDETNPCAEFALLVDDEEIDGTHRVLTAGDDFNPIYLRKQFSFTSGSGAGGASPLSKGIHKIGVYCKVYPRGSGGDTVFRWPHIFVDPRGIVIDLLLR